MRALGVQVDIPGRPATRTLSLPTDLPASENGRRCGTDKLGMMNWDAASRRDWLSELGVAERALRRGEEGPRELAPREALLATDAVLERRAETPGFMRGELADGSSKSSSESSADEDTDAMLMPVGAGEGS